MPFQKTQEDDERFWSKVEQGGHSGCWVWQGQHTQSGYGVFWFDGKNQRAHRYAYMRHHGRWPSGLVCHTCDNRACVNPNHLYDGTPRQNTADMDARKRRGRHKLTEYQVQVVRVLIGLGLSQSEIARRYNVTSATIHKIAHRKNGDSIPDLDLEVHQIAR